MTARAIERARPERLEYLDALRGLAILGVVLSHTSDLVPGVDLLAGQLCRAGKYGVQLFFVVSAFTLWSSLRRTPADDGPGIAAFFVRRAFRILPAYWLALVAWTFLYTHAPGDGHWRRVALAATFLNGLSPEAINYIPPGGWSVTDEVMFYLAVPFLAGRLKSVRSAAWALALSVLVAVLAESALMDERGRDLLHRALGVPLDVLHGTYWSHSWFFHFWFPAELPVFLVGVLAYRMAQRWPSPSRVVSLALVALGLQGIAFVALSMERMFGLRQVVIGLAFGLLLLGLRSRPLPVFVSSATRRIGRVSFSIYLIHMAVIGALGRACGTSLGALFGTQALVAVAALFAAVMVITWACAEISYRFVERPGIELGRRLSDKLDQRPVIRSSASG